VIWVPRTGRYHAFRLSASWGAPGLADTQPAGLAAQIEQAERAAASVESASVGASTLAAGR
jgi:hypothetical protein